MKQTRASRSGARGVAAAGGEQGGRDVGIRLITILIKGQALSSQGWDVPASEVKVLKSNMMRMRRQKSNRTRWRGSVERRGDMT